MPSSSDININFLERTLCRLSNSDLADEDLIAMIREFRQDNPDVGESMAAGLLRARGYRVVRARIRDALRNSDPLSTALRWPGRITRRRVYSPWGSCFHDRPPHACKQSKLG